MDRSMHVHSGSCESVIPPASSSGSGAAASARPRTRPKPPRPRRHQRSGRAVPYADMLLLVLSCVCGATKQMMRARPPPRPLFYVVRPSAAVARWPVHACGDSADWRTHVPILGCMHLGPRLIMDRGAWGRRARGRRRHLGHRQEWPF